MEAPARLRSMIDRLVIACREDTRIRGAWFGGSLARGIADEWSDLDLHVLVPDPAAVDGAAWMGALTPLVLADPIPGVEGGFIFVTPDWVHVDLVVHGVDGFGQLDLPSLVLIDRDGLVRDIPGSPIMATEPYFPDDQVRLFCYVMGNLPVVIHRGEVVAASAGTAMMRDRLLVPLMLAENGIHKADGAKRLNRYLTDDQHAALEALPPIAIDRSAILAAQVAIAEQYLSRARALARLCGCEYPSELEAAAVRTWRTELGLQLEL